MSLMLSAGFPFFATQSALNACQPRTTHSSKAFSEMGELADAITKRNRDGIIDGLGDVLVCLTMVAAIEDVDLKQCFASAYDQIKDRKGYLNATGVFVKDA